MNSTQTLVFYISIFVFSIYSLSRSDRAKSKMGKKMSIILSALPLWFLNVFRASSVGTDYVSVGWRFSNIANNIELSSSYDWSLPLKVFCKIIGFIFGSNPFWFYFVLGTLFIIFLYKALISNCENKATSLMLFIIFGLYLQSFNQIRQILALVIILYSTKHLKDGNLKKYIITILFASVFHESALIFILLYPLRNVELDFKMLFFYLLIAIVLFFFDEWIFKIVSLTKYSIYYTTQYNVSGNKSTIFNFVVRMIILLFCLLFRKELVQDKLYNFSYHMAIICILLQILAIKYLFFGRLTTYFFSFYIIVLARCLYLFLKRFSSNKKFVMQLLIFVALFMYFITYYNSFSGSIGSGYNYYEFIFHEWNNS